MKQNLKFAVSLMLTVSILLTGKNAILACGPFTLSPVFGFTKHGEYPLKDFSAGKLGIIPDSYGRISLFVFYRYLNQMPLDQSEQEKVTQAIARRIGISVLGDTEVGPESTQTADSNAVESPVNKWLKARAAVVTDKKEVEPDKLIENNYSYLRNCLAGAFDTATQTLRKRAAQGSAADLKEWVRGQDAVFSNCPSNGEVPQEAGTNAPVWLKKDRAYQRAAALFYRDELFEAREAFERISDDPESEWADISKYLIARTYIREASFLEAKDKTAEEIEKTETRRRELLMMAAGSLNGVINDPKLEALHESAENLQGLVKYRLDPDKRTRELAGILSSPTPNPRIYHNLTDYILLLDSIEQKAEKRKNESKTEDEPEDEDYWYYRVRLRDVPEDERAEDLTDWLITYQAHDGYEHAFDKWKETKQTHWLTAAIAKAKANSKDVDDLVAAARQLVPDSAAYSTASYHSIRLMLEKGDTTSARTLVDSVFAAGFDRLPTATRNSFYAQRLPLSQDLTEFLKYSKRKPTDFLWSDDGNEQGSVPAELQDMSAWKNREMFGDDSAAVLNSDVPLELWLNAANNPELPDYLRDFIVSAGWTRAFMLNNTRMERAFAPLVSKYSKDFSPLFSLYAKTGTARDKEAAALKVIGRYPVMEPSIPSAWGRKGESPLVIDSNRGNWWCLDPATDQDHRKPSFLTAAQFEAGKREYRELRGLGEGSTAYAQRAIAFARSNPRHRLTPEILHLAVRATRYGCRDQNTGAASKAAFDLLHRRYPRSQWTRKTPFWYS